MARHKTQYQEAAQRWPGRRGALLFALAALLAIQMGLPRLGVLAPVQAQSTPPAQPPVVHPWEELGGSLAMAVGPEPLLLYGAALLSTPPLVLWADKPVQDVFQRHNPLSEAFGVGAFWIGGGAPILLPAGLYVGGLLSDHNELATAGAAALQAGLFQLIAVSTLKWLTDRAGPFPDGDPEEERWDGSVFHDSDDPKDFDFNPFDITWGLRFPSGHTASNIAIVSALVAFYPDELWLPLLGYPLALAIGVGMIEGDYHWLSDVVAGGLIGHAIGWSVGSHFRKVFDSQRDGDAAHTWVRPVVAPGVLMLFASGPL